MVYHRGTTFGGETRRETVRRGCGAAGTIDAGRRSVVAAARAVAAAVAFFAATCDIATAAGPSGIAEIVAAAEKAKRTEPHTPATPPRAAPAREPDLALSDFSVGGDATRTVVTVDLSHPVGLRVFGLADPTRVVVDLPAARFDATQDAARAARALVVGSRFGTSAAGRSRLVIETRGAVRVVRAEFDATAPAGTTRLLVELTPGSEDDMRRAAPIHVAPPAVDASSGGMAAAKGDRQSSAKAAVAAAPARRPVVVIDPGHGGGDAGTVSPASGMPEKTVVLEMSRVLARRLRDTGRYEVVVTRTEDVFLGLGERVRIARARHADLLLSIHADAEYDHSVRGATVYTLAETASDEKAAALAAKENQSDALAGHVVEEAESVVADILADLTVRETRRLSLGLARDLLDEYRRHGRLVKSAPHRQAGLKVLRAHDVPSALIELGFLSNKEDEALLTSADWREKTAQSIVTAVDRWFADRGGALEATKDGGLGAPASP